MTSIFTVIPLIFTVIPLGISVWTTLGSERLFRIAISDCGDHLILLRDNDRAV